MAAIKDVDSVLGTVKGNVDEMRSILSNWESSLLFERKESKTYQARELEESFSSMVSQRHREIQEGGKQLVKLLSNSNRTLKVRHRLKDAVAREGDRWAKRRRHGRPM